MTQAQYNALVDRIEAKYVVPVYKALRSQISSFTDDLKTVGMNAALNNMDTDLFNEKIAVVIEKLYREVGLAAANITYGALQKYKVKRGFGFNQTWLNNILNYFKQHIFNKIVIPITAKTKKQIRDVLAKGLREGWGEDKIVRELNSPELVKWRAKTIVRTEVGGAIGRGQYEGATAYEYETIKKWQYVKDTRTRKSHTHDGVGDQEVDVNARFSNGLLHPGDKAGSAKETINCRCRMRIMPKRDSRGRLIPK